METDGTEPSVFHEGEQLIHDRFGIRDKIALVARRGIREYMPDQYREFFAQLPFLITGSMDDDGQPWASILVNNPGFISSPDDRRLVISATPLSVDPLHRILQTGTHLGTLGIELHTRRRNRVNGIVTDVSDTGFRLQVDQSFGNCPKYIQARQPLIGSNHWIQTNSSLSHRSTTLDKDMVRIVRQADTFFIASAYHLAQNQELGQLATPLQSARASAYGVDVSHRGGKPGFVQVDAVHNSLIVPDYLGNYFFNTLGNLLLNPKAGLLFMDFQSGDLLYLATEVEIIWDGPELEVHDGAQRLLHLQVTQALRVESVLPWTWSAAELSPHLSRT